MADTPDLPPLPNPAWWANLYEREEVQAYAREAVRLALAARKPLKNNEAMRVVINACDSLNITRVHELGGKTRTICDEAGLLEIARAVERAHGITQDGERDHG